MRSYQNNQTMNTTASACSASACFAASKNLISLHTLNISLGVLILSVLRLFVGSIRLLAPMNMSLNRM